MTTEERLGRLEKQARRLRLCVWGLVLLGACALLLAAGSGNLKADRLEIVQPNGKTGILLKATDDGGAIFIYGASRKKGLPMISIFAIPQENGGGSQIFMHGSKGQNAVNIVAQKKGNVRTW